MTQLTYMYIYKYVCNSNLHVTQHASNKPSAEANPHGMIAGLSYNPKSDAFFCRNLVICTSIHPILLIPRCNCTAYQRLCFRNIESTIPLLSKSEAICCGYTFRFVSGLVGNPENILSRDADKIVPARPYHIPCLSYQPIYHIEPTRPYHLTNHICHAIPYSMFCIQYRPIGHSIPARP